MNCAKRDTSSARIAVQMIAAYAHLGPFSRKVIDAIDARLAALDEQMPVPVVLTARPWRDIWPDIRPR